MHSGKLGYGFGFVCDARIAPLCLLPASLSRGIVRVPRPSFSSLLGPSGCPVPSVTYK